MNAIMHAPYSPTFRRFQELVLYFFAASLVGHYLELVWILFRYHRIHTESLVQSLTFVPLPLAEPYGFGAIALVLFVVPLVKKYKPHPAVTFFVTMIMMATVEYVCAALLTFAFGYNTYWDYSDHPFNIQGYICLETSALFGLLATVFTYYVYPWTEQRLSALSLRTLRSTTITLTVLYAVHFIRLAVLAV